VSAKSVVLCALVVAFFVGGVRAQDIYQWRDAQGTVHFSDKPPSYPADVTVHDGEISAPSDPTPRASRAKSSRAYFTSNAREAATPRDVPANPSISSLIDGGTRSNSRRITPNAASAESAESTETNSGTTLGDLSSQQTVVRRSARGAAARANVPTDDLAVPSLDGALSQNLTMDGASDSANLRRPRTQPGLSQFGSAGP